MSRRIFTQAWYADEKRNRSTTKVVVLSDRGTLELDSGLLTFTGKKIKFQISKINHMAIVRQQIPWIAYLVMNIFLVFYLAWLASSLSLNTLSFVLLILVPANVFGLLIAYNTKWIRVEYSDDKDQPSTALFADGSSFGWGGLFGGTERMYTAINVAMTEENLAQNPGSPS